MKYIPQYVYYNLLAHILFLTSSHVLVLLLYISIPFLTKALHALLKRIFSLLFYCICKHLCGSMLCAVPFLKVLVLPKNKREIGLAPTTIGITNYLF